MNIEKSNVNKHGKSVPQIYLKDQLIGGYVDLVKYIEF